jgi:hypothetical protein
MNDINQLIEAIQAKANLYDAYSKQQFRPFHERKIFNRDCNTILDILEMVKKWAKDENL